MITKNRYARLPGTMVQFYSLVCKFFVPHRLHGDVDPNDNLEIYHKATLHNFLESVINAVSHITLEFVK